MVTCSPKIPKAFIKVMRSIRRFEIPRRNFGSMDRQFIKMDHSMNICSLVRDPLMAGYRWLPWYPATVQAAVGMYPVLPWMVGTHSVASVPTGDIPALSSSALSLRRRVLAWWPDGDGQMPQHSNRRSRGICVRNPQLSYQICAVTFIPTSSNVCFFFSCCKNFL